VSVSIVAIGVAVLLVAIGTLEARESARQLAELTSFTHIQPAGAGLSALGVALSAALYVAMGWWVREDRRALRLGLAVGVAAGLVGGSIRAWLIADAVRDAIARFAEVPDWFVSIVLIVFVALSLLVSAAGGAALAFAGVRLSRSSRNRPRP
jgi:hypothetical protein